MVGEEEGWGGGCWGFVSLVLRVGERQGGEGRGWVRVEELTISR
jgi:hypothetical protein